MARFLEDRPLVDPNTTVAGANDYSNSPNIQRDPRFFADLRTWYEKQGYSRLTDDELLERFHSDQTWQMMNTVSAVRSAGDALTMSDADKQLLNRLQNAYAKLPNFWQEGGRGFMAAAADAVPAILADPINLIPGVNAYAKGAVAARGATVAGRSAMRAGITAGARSGAVSEGIISGAQEGIVNAANQIRDTQIGAQDGFSTSQLLGATALGTGLGAGVGGLIGGVSGAAAARRGVQQAEAGRFMGGSPEEITNLSYRAGERVVADAASRAGPYMPTDVQAERAAQAAAQTAEEQRAAAQAEANRDPIAERWDAHSRAVDQMHTNLQDEATRMRREGAPEAHIAEVDQLAVQTNRLREMQERLRLEEEEIRKFGRTSDPAKQAKHTQRVAAFERDYADWRALVDETMDGDADAIKARVDELVNAAIARADEAAKGPADAVTPPAAEAGAAGTAPEAGTAPSPEDGVVPAAAEPTTITTEAVTDPVEELAPVQYRSEGQATSVRALLESAGMTENDLAQMISDGTIKTGARGKSKGLLTQEGAKELRRIVGERKATTDASARADQDVPQAEALDPTAATAPTSSPTFTAPTGNMQRGQAIFGGIDPNNIKARKNAKGGALTQAQVDKAVAARAADAEPDEYAAAAQQELNEILDLIGPMEDDVEVIRSAINVLAQSRDKGRASADDLVSLFDYANSRAIDGPTSASPAPFTKTELEKIKRQKRIVMRQQPGITPQLAEEIATGQVLAVRGEPQVTMRNTSDKIEEAKKLTTAGRTSTGRIQSFLRRGTRISKGSDYTVTGEGRVRRNEFGFEEALIRARSGNGPDVVQYVTQGTETIMTRNGKQQVPKGTTAYADAVSRRSFDSMDLALEYRGDKVSAAAAQPTKAAEVAPTNNLAQLLEKFGNDPRAFAEALAAARKGEAPKTTAARAAEMFPLQRGDKYIIVRSKTNPNDVRMISPKQAEAGGTIQDIIGKKSTPDEWDVKYADKSQFTRDKNKLRDVFARTQGDEAGTNPDGTPASGLRPETGYQTSMGRALTLDEAMERTIGDLDLTKEETASLMYLSKKTNPDEIRNLTLHDLNLLEARANTVPFGKTTEEFQAVLRAMTSLHKVIDRVAPMGFELNNVSRIKSIESLDRIFAGVSSDELAAAKDFITRMGGDPRVGPRIEPQDVTASTGLGSYQWSVNEVRVGVASADQMKRLSPAPRISTFYHEMAHWAYMNILTPKDRADFWEMVGRKYYSDGKVDTPALRDAAPTQPAYGDQLLNYNPSELFANEFDKWMIGSRGPAFVKDASYWQRVVRYMKSIFDRYFSGAPIDPEFEPLFAKILPDGDRRAFSLGRDADASTPAGQTYNRRFQQLQMDEDQFIEALNADSADGIVNAAITLRDSFLSLAPSVRWAADNGKTGTLKPLLPLRRMLRQRIDDINEILGNKPVDWKDYDATGALPKWMSDEGLADIGDPQAKADALRELFFNGYAGKWQPADGIPGQIKRPEKASLKDMLGMAKRNLEAAYSRAESGGLPPTAKPEIDGAAAASDTVSKTKRKARKKSDRLERVTSSAAAAEISKPANKRTRRAPKKGRAADPAYAESLKDKSINDLRKMYREHRGTDRGDQVAFELIAKERAAPLPAREVPVPNEVIQANREQLEGMLLKGLSDNDKTMVDQALYEMRRRATNKGLKKSGQPTIRATLLKRSFIDKEINDNIGTATSDGIPPAARASVRELLSYITHRDPMAQHASRTMAYRMLNLLNKTTQDVLGEVNVISTGDLARLAGVDRNVVGENAFVDLRGPEFKRFRSDMRRMSIALTKGSSNPFDVMHEIGHAVFRSGMIPEEEMAAVREAYRLSTDAVKDRIVKSYSAKYADRTEPLEDLLAEEWMAESLSLYMAERVAKGDILRAAIDGDIGNLRLRNGFSRALDRAVEYVAYLLNGLVGRNDIKQQFRRLFLYGDMFERQTPAPLATAIRRRGAVPASYASDAVADMLRNSPKNRLAKIRTFVRGSLSHNAETDSFIEWYHGTPAGYAFHKQTNPDVILERSRTGQYGDGVYLTKSAAIASEVYSKKPTTESVMKQIQDLQRAGTINDEVAAEMTFATKDLYMVRTEISKQRRKYSDIMQFNIDKDRAAYVKERLDYLVDEEAELQDFLTQAGVKIEPMVIPTFVAVRNPADFRVTAVYTPQNNAIAQLFIDHARMMDNLDPQALRRFRNDVTTRTYNGKEMYDRTVELYTQSGRDPVEAKNEINGILDDSGYDAIQSTHSNTLGIDGTEVMLNGETYEGSVTAFEALTVFDSSKVKHVDADEFDEFDDRLFFRSASAMPNGVTGDILGGLMRREISSPSDVNPGSLGEYLESEGVSSSLSGAIMSMLRGRNLDVKEEQAIRKVSPVAWFQSQSDRMSDLGAKYLSEWYEKSFRDVQQKFAGKFFPIQRELRKLPDADGKIRAWARSATAGVGQKQPESYTKIVKALRFGKGSRQFAALNGQEQRVYNMIRKMFADERDEMLSMGIYVGNRGDDYVPQVWKGDVIQANKDEFLSKMKMYFFRERDAKGITEYPPEAADEFANGLYETLAGLDADGTFVPVKGGSRNPKFENVDFSRVIELEKYPDMLREFEKFLEDDLEFLLTKYLEGSSRRITHTRDMGVNSHAFYDYLTVVDEGSKGIVKLLSRNKEFRKDIRALNQEGWMDYGSLATTVNMPFAGREGQAAAFVNDLMAVHADKGAGAARRMLDEIAVKDASGQVPLAYKRRADAIIGALNDYKGQTKVLQPSDYEFMENALRIAMKKPQAGAGSRGLLNFTRGIRQFNSVTLLGFTTLTSIPDLVMPIIRGGSFTDYTKAVKNLATDPDYRQFVHDAGVAMENIVHERMTHIYGGVDSKFSNAFFNATMLTPWTDMNRHIAGATGYELFKTWQRIANNTYKPGVPVTEQSAKYKQVARWMKQYGMGDFLPDGAKKDVVLSDRRLVAEDEQVRMGMIDFADKSVFQPKGNDIPAWAQTPWGAVVFQLKSYPLMMTRLSGHVIREAKRGNVKPLLYLATLGPAAGATALGVKDIVQMRGGEDERSAELRNRNILKNLGYDEKVHGNEDDFLGWYVEGMLAMGGLGLLADVFHSTVTQLDNGAYGKVRLLSTIGGPIVGDVEMAVDIGAGIQDALLGDPDKNSKERQGVRAFSSRIPVLGGMRSFREGVVDAVAGEQAQRGRQPYDMSFGSDGFDFNFDFGDQ